MKITENKSGYLPEVFGRNAAFQNLLKNTKTGRSLCVSGLFPVAKANIINALCRAKKKTALCIASDEREAQTLCNDLSCMGLSALVYPVRDYTFLEEISSRSHEYEHQRIKVLLKLLDGDCDVVIACVDAACQLTVPRQVLRDTVIEFSEGKEIPIEKAVRTLTLLMGSCVSTSHTTNRRCAATETDKSIKHTRRNKRFIKGKSNRFPLAHQFISP